MFPEYIYIKFRKEKYQIAAFLLNTFSHTNFVDVFQWNVLRALNDEIK